MNIMQEVCFSNKKGEKKTLLLFERSFVEEYIYHINFEKLAYITLSKYKADEKSVFGCIDLTNLKPKVLYTSDFSKDTFINHYMYVFKFTKEHFEKAKTNPYAEYNEQKEASFLVETAKNIATKSSIVEEEVAKQLDSIYQK